MQKKSLTNKITPCCNLPYSVMKFIVDNLTLNSEADRTFIKNSLQQNGTLTIDAWKIWVTSGTLESDASLTKAEFLAWFDCGNQPSCPQLKLLIEGYKLGNYNPSDEYGVGWTEISSYEEYQDKIIKKVINYVGGMGAMPIELSENIGSYYAADGGFTTDKDLASDFKAENGVLKSDLIKRIPTISKNIFNKETITEGFYINHFNGNLIADANWFVSDFIPIEENTKYVGQMGYYAFYNDNNVFVNGGLENGSGGTSGSGATKLRISYPLSDLDIIMVEKGNTVSEFEPYYAIDKNQVIGLKDFQEYLLNVSPNLFDKSKITENYYVNFSGEIESQPDWFISSPINIIAGQRYVGLGLFRFQDDAGNKINYGLDNGSGAIAGVGSTKLIVSSPLIDLDKMQVEKGDKPTSYKNFYAIGKESIVDEDEIYKVTELIVRAGGTIGVNCDFTDTKSALESITDNSKSNRYVLKIKDGIYDISSSPDKYLGIKNYVICDLQSPNTIFINRKSTFINDAAIFDVEFYTEAIEYARIQGGTFIQFNGKAPIHLDSGYNKFKSGGLIEIIDCNLINENTAGMTHYQNGLACGLRDGQRVVVKNVRSNGKLWCHTANKVTHHTGCTFELYNCQFPYTMIADIYTYGRDKLVMHNCKTLFVDFNLSNPNGLKENYTDYSWEVDMCGNEIGYIIGSGDDPNDRFSTWDEAFGGKLGITDSSIHMYCRNNSASALNRGDLVTLIAPTNEISVKKKTSSDILYGQAMEDISAGEYGTIQYRGVLFLPTSVTFAINDYVALDANNNAILGTQSDHIGVSLDNGTTEIRCQLNK